MYILVWIVRIIFIYFSHKNFKIYYYFISLFLFQKKKKSLPNTLLAYENED
jgi:hypothetical protein